MKISLTVAILLILATGQLCSGQGRCGEDLFHARAERLDPDGSKRKEVFKQFIDKQKNHAIRPRSNNVIPVVVHIVYNKAEENIDDEQIKSQIEALNADYAALRVSGDIPDPFEGLTGETGFSFCLADQDESGQPTSGIVRKQTSVQNIGLQEDQTGRLLLHYDFLGGSTAWPVDQYLNIWVCRMDQYLGYATKPGDPVFEGEDGVVIDYRAFGTKGASLIDEQHREGRTAVHEVGHYFGLLHLWGSGASGCGDDFVDDTPPQSLPHFGCPNFPQHSCGSSNMFMNFMDYVDDGCMYMFSKGQCTRMHQTLEINRIGLLAGDKTNCSSFEKPVNNLSDRIRLNSSVLSDQLFLIQDKSYKEVIQIYIYDVMGRLQKSMLRIAWDEMWICDRSELQPGYYILVLRTNEDSLTLKFLTI